MSTSPKHTPGPWHWRLSDNATPHIEHGDCLPDEIGMLKNRVCVMPSEIMHDYNSLANARLIAAAPEMLEALEYVAMIAHEGGLIGLSEADAIIAIRKLSARWCNLSKSKSESIEALNNAIAKAKGGQP
jgi:hypothetical protein